MIYWFLLVGVIAGAIWKVTGGRLGFPREESLVEFFRRVAERPPLPEPLPAGLERGRDGIVRARTIRPALQWRRIPVAGSPGLELWQSWRAGRPLPPAPQILVTSTALPGVGGTAYAVLGDWKPYRDELRDRWVLLEPIVQREPEGEAANRAADAIKRLLGGAGPPGRVSADQVRALAEGKA